MRTPGKLGACQGFSPCATPPRLSASRPSWAVLPGPFYEQGQASIGLLVRDPAVTARMQQIAQYLDVAKLAAIMRDPAPGKP